MQQSVGLDGLPCQRRIHSTNKSTRLQVALNHVETMTFQQELSSWFSPTPANTNTPPEAPAIGSKAPDTAKLRVGNGKPTVIAFLRHCGCPFAEKTFLNLREAARAHKNLAFTAVSHSSAAATETWLKSLPQAGSEPANLDIVVDPEVYGAWGLGPSSYAHVLSPGSLYAVWKLGQSENIWNRPTESGSRWQTSGFFAVDGGGVVRWGRAAERADDIPDFEEAVRVLEGDGEIEAKL